jgi:hypothetical protein
MKNLFYFSLMLLSLLSCNSEPTVSEVTSLKLTFNHVVGSEPLVLNSTRYANALGQEYNISKFRYYVSNIRLRNTRNGEVYIEPESYHLVGTENGSSFDVTLSDIPLGSYNQLEIAIGVDNSTNTSTDRQGALDPSNDMAWDWNTGYKFILLEGNYYPENADPAALVFHVGGDLNYRILTYTLGQSGPGELELRADTETALDIQVDISRLFEMPNAVDFDAYPVVMFDPFSQKIADNYGTDMFTIQSIE